MLATESKPRIKAHSILTPKQENKPSLPHADTVVVRRCCVCGSMGLENLDIDTSITVTLDGIEHALAVCKSNGACTYQAQLLKERLEFIDFD